MEALLALLIFQIFAGHKAVGDWPKTVTGTLKHHPRDLVKIVEENNALLKKLKATSPPNVSQSALTYP